MRLTLHATFVRCVFTAVFMSLSVGSFSMGAAPAKLNVLLIMADDLRDFGGPHTMAGRSLTPILASPLAKTKDEAFTLVTRGPKLFGQSVRTDRWRFTQWSDGAQELYDHDKDPEENHNVATVNPVAANELSSRLKTLPLLRP